MTDLGDMVWVGEMIRQAAVACPDRKAIIMPETGTTLSYQELERQIGRALLLLREHGLEPGDRIAYLGKNHALFYVLLFAAIRGGFIIAPLNWRCVAPEIRYFLEDSKAKLLFCDPDFSQIANEAMADLPSPPQLLSTAADGEQSAFVSQLAQDGEVAEGECTLDSKCLLLYTSGTSGRPKGALCTHRALSLSRHAEFIYERFPQWQQGTIIAAMPHFHIGGISWTLIGLIRQSTCILTVDPSGPNLTRLIREYKALATFAVPTVVRAIVEEVRTSGEPVPSLEHIFYGAAPIGESLLRESLDVLGCRFGQFYGMTEITGSATFLPPDAHDIARPDLMQSVGCPLPGVSLDIRDEAGNSFPPGTAGEIWVHTPTLMAEYWNKPEETAKAVHDGWYRSGDGGYLNGEGYLFLTDRIKDIIVSGGENIYPAEVEEAVRQHPAVLDTAVVAKPDDRWGEAVMAVVEKRPGEDIDRDALIEFARARVAGFKCPKEVVFVDSLPRTASGKVQRNKAREMALEKLSS